MQSGRTVCKLLRCGLLDPDGMTSDPDIPGAARTHAMAAADVLSGQAMTELVRMRPYDDAATHG